MKKLFLFLLGFFVMSSISATQTAVAEGEEITRIVIIKGSIGDIPIQRSVVPIEAYYDHTQHLILLDFTEDLGTVSVTINNTNGIIAAQNVNSASGSGTIVLPATANGECTIYILTATTGETFEGRFSL